MTTSGGTTVVNGVSYNAANQLLGMTYNGIGETRGYNVLNQLTSIVAGSTENLTYTYPAGPNNNGKVSSMYNAVSGETVTYTYDSLTRLATAAGSGWGEQYTFDPFGNLTTKHVTAGSGPSLSVSVNPANNQIEGLGGYDANGNAYMANAAYDVENRIYALVGVSPYTSYSYDAQGERIFLWAGTSDSNNNPTSYSVVAYSASGQKLGTYLLIPGAYYSGGNYVACIDVSVATSDQYFGGRRLAVMDQLGSAGTYYPWGEAKGSTNPQDTWSYATYWRDSATGLDYANNRYYSNSYGRFMTPDPYQASGGPADPQSWNRYAYTRGDPVNRLDPSGLQDEGPPPDGCWVNGLWWDPCPGIPPGEPTGQQPNRGGPRTCPRGLVLDNRGHCVVQVTDPSVNKWAQDTLAKAFANFQGSNCDKDFAAVLPNYTTQGFVQYDEAINFYAANGADSDLTQNQVSGNGNSTTLGNTIGLGQTAVTLTSAQGALIPAVLLGNGIFNFQGAGDVLIHELLHAFTGWNDGTIYQDFAKYGLVNPGDGSTSAISRWIGTDCTKTPADSAP